jgi:hypothetical protein
LFYGSKNPSFKARDAIRVKAAEMKCMRKKGGYTWRDYKKIQRLQWN